MYDEAKAQYDAEVEAEHERINATIKDIMKQRPVAGDEPFEASTKLGAFNEETGEYDEYDAMDVPASRLAGHAVYVDKSGDPILFPAWSYSGSISYDWSVSGFAVTAETNYSYRDEYPSWLGAKYCFSNA